MSELNKSPDAYCQWKGEQATWKNPKPFYSTSCDNIYWNGSTNPIINVTGELKYCPYCGKIIAIKMKEHKDDPLLN